MERVEREQLRSFWDEVVKATGTDDDAQGRSLVVTHLLGDRPYFLEALDRIAPIARVLAKPKSIDSSAFRRAADRFSVAVADRKKLATKSGIDDLLSIAAFSDEPTLAIDIGAYFAPGIRHLAEEVRQLLAQWRSRSGIG